MIAIAAEKNGSDYSPPFLQGFAFRCILKSAYIHISYGFETETAAGGKEDAYDCGNQHPDSAGPVASDDIRSDLYGSGRFLYPEGSPKDHPDHQRPLPEPDRAEPVGI